MPKTQLINVKSLKAFAHGHGCHSGMRDVIVDGVKVQMEFMVSRTTGTPVPLPQPLAGEKGIHPMVVKSWKRRMELPDSD